MHEMGLVLQAIDELKEVCEANDVTRLISVTLEIGEASMVEQDYFRTCWDAAVNDTDWKQVKLKIHIVKAKGRCLTCAHEFYIKENDQTCPYCGAKDNFYPVTGKDLEISEIEAE